MLSNAEKDTMQSKNCLIVLGIGIVFGLLVIRCKPLAGESLGPIIVFCAILGLFHLFCFWVCYQNRASDFLVPLGAGWLAFLAPFSMLPAIWFFQDSMETATVSWILFNSLVAVTLVRRWPVEPASESESGTQGPTSVTGSTGTESGICVSTPITEGEGSNA